MPGSGKTDLQGSTADGHLVPAENWRDWHAEHRNSTAADISAATCQYERLKL